MSEKTYVFHVSRGANQHERFELTEDQLEEKHRKLLFGALWKQWENTPKRQQAEFVAKIAEQSAERVIDMLTRENEKLSKQFEERADLDDKIDRLIKLWKEADKLETGPVTAMIRLIEKQFSYVRIYIENKKLQVRIHDGEQTFN